MKPPLQVSSPAWNPFTPASGGRQRFFGFGEVRLVVLSLLKESPHHGYQLMKELTARLGKLYRASSGTVYPVLQQLEKDRLVEWQMEQGRKIYSLTKTGRAALAKEAATVKGIWSRAAEIEDLGHQLGPSSMAVAGPMSELIAATLRAAAWTAGDPNREDQVRGILRNASAKLNEVSGATTPSRRRNDESR